jgi:hypothetical protein
MVPIGYNADFLGIPKYADSWKMWFNTEAAKEDLFVQTSLPLLAMGIRMNTLRSSELGYGGPQIARRLVLITDFIKTKMRR